MFISNRSRKGNIIGLARLTTENYNRYLKKLLICIPLMIIFFNLLGFIYQQVFIYQYFTALPLILSTISSFRVI